MAYIKKFLLSSFFFLLTGYFSLSYAHSHTTWGSQFAEYIETSNSNIDVKRAKHLKLLLTKNAGRPVQHKLAAVNKFFNQVRWASDSEHWGKKDYWQTPLETLITFKGDCEDVAIAKYAALREMGISEENLALVYAMKKGQPHMVLAFYQKPDAEPIILDNNDNLTLKASHRKDLRPIYSFNCTTLWLTDPGMRKIGSGRAVPESHKFANLTPLK